MAHSTINQTSQEISLDRETYTSLPPVYIGNTKMLSPTMQTRSHCSAATI